MRLVLVSTLCFGPLVSSLDVPQQQPQLLNCHELPALHHKISQSHTDPTDPTDLEEEEKLLSTHYTKSVLKTDHPTPKSHAYHHLGN
jgi:hypothetical protein